MPPYTHQDPAERGARFEFRSTLVVLILAFSLARLPADFQGSVAAAFRGTALRPFLSLQQRLVVARSRAEQASVLQARIDSLAALNVAGTTLAEENRRLRGLLNLAERVGPRWMAVRVLRPGSTDSESILIVDVGSAGGLAPRSPIITREGLAGVVRESHGDYAVGMDWTHPDFRASAMTLDGLHYGMVRSERELFGNETRLVFEGLPYHADLDSAAVVVTSGEGGVFPRGIPIGRVVAVASEQEEWRKSFWLDPLVAPGSVTLALVARDDPTPLGAMTPGWEDTGYLRADQDVRRERSLVDSLRVLRDSVAALERRLLPPAGEGGS